MKPNPAPQEKHGGLRGRDKQQSDLRDQTSEQGIVQDQRGQEQPRDKDRAQRTAAGIESQKEAAQQQPPSPGEPAGGE